MTLGTAKDIPEEIKHVIELFYLENEEEARKEAEILRKSKPGLSRLVEAVLQLFPIAPESVFMFYDAIIAADSESSGFDSEEYEVSELVNVGDLVGDLMGDDMPEHTSDADALMFNFDDEDDAAPSPSPSKGAQGPEAKRSAPKLVPLGAVAKPAKKENLDSAKKRGELKSVFNTLMTDPANISDSSFELMLNQSVDGAGVPPIASSGQPAQECHSISKALSSSPELKSCDIALDIDVDHDMFINYEEVVVNRADVCPFDDDENAVTAPSQKICSELAHEMAGVNSMTGFKKIQERDAVASSSLPSIIHNGRRAPSGSIKGVNRTITGSKSRELTDKEFDMLKTIPNAKGIPLEALYGADDADCGMLSTLPSADGIPDDVLCYRSDQYPARASSHFGVPDKKEDDLKTVADTSCVDEKALQSMSGAEGQETSEGQDVDALKSLEPLTRIVSLKCSMSEVAERSNVNHKAGFILSMVDGRLTIADILDISSWAEKETAQVLWCLKKSGIIDFG